VGERAPSEVALATLLSDVLADHGWWAEFAASSPRRSHARVLANRAVDLYRTTGRFIETRLDAAVEPVDRAVGVLREIADGAALRSNAWAVEFDGDIRLPDRPLIELMIRIDDVDDWAARFGRDLPLSHHEGVPDDVWPSESPGGLDFGPDDFLDAWAVLPETFGAVVDRRNEIAAATESEHLDSFREAAATLIYETRNWLRWVRGNLPAEAEVLAVAAVFMAQGTFVAAWDASTTEGLFPSAAYLSELLHRSDALDWLNEHGRSTPDWLT
jgi:hypothetical protein